jgi:hypothetical protein
MVESDSKMVETKVKSNRKRNKKVYRQGRGRRRVDLCAAQSEPIMKKKRILNCVIGGQILEFLPRSTLVGRGPLLVVGRWSQDNMHDMTRTTRLVTGLESGRSTGQSREGKHPES